MDTNTVNGLRFKITNPTDVIQRKLVKGTQWNRWCVDTVTQLQKQHGLKHMVNAGSHIGTVALPLSRVFEHVTCFEPYPPSFKHLEENIHLNQILNIRTINAALGDKKDTVFFTQAPSNNSGGTHSLTQEDIAQGRKSSDRVNKRYSRPILPLDTCDVFDFDLLLMDVEGTEWQALHGAKQKIDQYKPIILTEIWDDPKRIQEKLATSKQDVIDLVEGWGYSLIKHKKDDYLFMPNHLA